MVIISGEDTRNPNTQKANGASIAAGMVGDIMQVSFSKWIPFEFNVYPVCGTESQNIARWWRRIE